MGRIGILISCFLFWNCNSKQSQKVEEQKGTPQQDYTINFNGIDTISKTAAIQKHGAPKKIFKRKAKDLFHPDTLYHVYKKLPDNDTTTVEIYLWHLYGLETISVYYQIGKDKPVYYEYNGLLETRTRQLKPHPYYDLDTLIKTQDSIKVPIPKKRY